MSVRFVIGRSGTGKTAFCQHDIQQKLKETPNGRPLIYLVPDQMTFDTEVTIASTAGLNGMTSLNVYSFSRLALRVLQSVGGITRYHLSNVGISMLLRKIIEKEYDSLKVFQKASKQLGFYDDLSRTITELKKYCISPQVLERQWQRIVEKTPSNDELLVDKLHDLNVIYYQLEQALLGKYTDSEDYLSLLAERCHLDKTLKDTEVWIDGFHEFTPQELQVIQQLMINSKRVTITLTLENPNHVSNSLSLFRQTEHTYYKLRSLAEEKKIIIEETISFHHPNRYQSDELKHIERVYEKRPIQPGISTGAVEVIEAANRRIEVEHVGRKIFQLVREEGYRFRDIAVVTRDLPAYEGLFRTIFKDDNIPTFIDQKRTMRHHPVIEFIRSTLDIIDQNWRYEAVFRCIKTDLLFPLDSDLNDEREGMDRLENIVIGYGIYGNRWKDKKTWYYKRDRGLDQADRPQTREDLAFQKKINHLRMQIVYPISEFEDKLKQAETVKEKCTVLYRFLEKMAISEKIEKLRYQAEKEGKLDEAREHDQVWQALIDLLDQLVETGGDEHLSLNTFVKVIDTGLETMKFALVPPAMDQLTIGSLDRSRLNRVKALFIVGVNDGIIPAKPTETGVLSDDDRDVLETIGMTLAPDTRSQLLDEEFLIYRALTSASDKLFVSYPLATEEGQTLLPSSIIGRLKKILPNLTERFAVSEPHEAKEDDQLLFVTNPLRTLSYTSSQVRQWLKGYPISSVWWDVYNWYIGNDEWRAKAKPILQSLFYKNKEDKLNSQTARALYGDTIRASVSRMELFNSCPFSQFVSYGLRLREREVFKLEAPDIGQLFHSALSRISKELQKSKQAWHDLNKDDCKKITGETINVLAPKLQKEILLSNSRYHYLKYKLQQVVERAVLTLSEHARASGFQPIGLELPFGPDQPLPPLEFQLSNGHKMEIVGRIDRVDKGTNQQGILLRVIDYKSSDKDLNFSDIYYGLSLQMLTYLDVVLTHAKTWLGQVALPAGVLYFHVHNPMLQETRTLTPNEIEARLLKQFKMKGLVLADETIVREMDQSLNTGYSDILPVALKKDGSFYKSSSVITQKQMSGLSQYVHHVIKDVGKRVSEGDIAISPYKLKNKTPCEYCSYKSVCQFDIGREENNYRHLPKLNEETMLDQILKDGVTNDDEY